MEKTVKKEYTIMTVYNRKHQQRFYPAIYLDKDHNWTQNIFPGKVFKTAAEAIEATKGYLKEDNA